MCRSALTKNPWTYIVELDIKLTTIINTKIYDCASPFLSASAKEAVSPPVWSLALVSWHYVRLISLYDPNVVSFGSYTSGVKYSEWIIGVTFVKMKIIFYSLSFFSVTSNCLVNNNLNIIGNGKFRSSGIGLFVCSCYIWPPCGIVCLEKVGVRVAAACRLGQW